MTGHPYVLVKFYDRICSGSGNPCTTEASCGDYETCDTTDLWRMEVHEVVAEDDVYTFDYTSFNFVPADDCGCVEGVDESATCSFAGPEWGQLPVERVEIASGTERLVIDNISQAVSWLGYHDDVVRQWQPSIFEPVGYGDSMLMSVRAWIDAYLEGRPPPVSGEDGLRTLQICEQIADSISAKTGS